MIVHQILSNRKNLIDRRWYAIISIKWILIRFFFAMSAHLTPFPSPFSSPFRHIIIISIEALSISKLSAIEALANWFCNILPICDRHFTLEGTMSNKKKVFQYDILKQEIFKYIRFHLRQFRIQILWKIYEFSFTLGPSFILLPWNLHPTYPNRSKTNMWQSYFGYVLNHRKTSQNLCIKDFPTFSE